MNRLRSLASAFGLTLAALVATPSLHAGFTTTGVNNTSGSYLYIGRAGVGTGVLDGGTVLDGFPGLVIGLDPTGDGNLLITGNGTKFLAWSTIMYVGRSGTGVLTIADGAEVGSLSDDNPLSGYIGGSNVPSGPSHPPGSGVVNVEDSGSLLTNTYLFIGHTGTGTLNISNGGHVVNEFTSVSFNVNTTGALNVTGAGSRLDTDFLVVGNDATATGTMDIGDHGTVVSTTYGYELASVGEDGHFSTGTMAVHDSGNLAVTGGMILGNGGAGTADFRSGAQVTSDTTAFASQAGSTVDVQVRGAGTLFDAGAARLGVDGTATVELKDGATLRASSLVLGDGAGSGTLTIGAGSAPGVLDVGAVRGGAGTAKLVFNHTDTTGAYVFANASSEGIAITGHVAVTHQAGTTTLTTASTYDGGTTLSGGTLFARNTSGSALGTGAISVLDGATLGGNGIIGGATTLASGAHLAADSNAGTLTFTNSLTLNDGAILDLRLGDVSDLIAISGADSTLTGSATLGSITVNLSDAGGFYGGTYALINFAGAHGGLNQFDADRFSLGSMIAGYTYHLALNGAALELTATAVPEPATYAACAGTTGLGLAFWRRRRTR